MRISDWSSDVCSSDLAEEHTIMRFEEARGKDTPNPSVRKSETGAIDRVELYGPADRRTFSADDAIAWLSNPVTGSSYQVELFEIPAPRSDWDGLDANRRRLYEYFIGGLNALSHGLSVERLPTRTRAHATPEDRSVGKTWVIPGISRRSAQ